MCKMRSVKPGTCLPRLSHELWTVGNEMRYGTKWTLNIFTFIRYCCGSSEQGTMPSVFFLNMRWHVLTEFNCIFILRACMQHMSSHLHLRIYGHCQLGVSICWTVSAVTPLTFIPTSRCTAGHWTLHKKFNSKKFKFNHLPGLRWAPKIRITGTHSTYTQ